MIPTDHDGDIFDAAFRTSKIKTNTTGSQQVTRSTLETKFRVEPRLEHQTKMFFSEETILKKQTLCTQPLNPSLQSKEIIMSPCFLMQ